MSSWEIGRTGDARPGIDAQRADGRNVDQQVHSGKASGVGAIWSKDHALYTVPLMVSSSGSSLPIKLSKSWRA